jgi:hypothetical protein
VDENIFCKFVHKVVNLSILHQHEDKEVNNLLHIKNQVKKTKIDDLFDSSSHANLIAVDVVNNIGLEVHNRPDPYPLGWVNKDAEIKLTKQCKIKFVVSVDFIDEVELDIVPLDVCEVVFGIPYMYMRDAIFIQRDKQFHPIKYDKSFIINMHKGK